MTVSVVFAIAGVIALLFGIVGGGIKAKEVEVPLLPMSTRIFTILIGLTLIGFTLWIENSKDTQVMNVVLTPSSSPLPQQTVAPITAQPSTIVRPEILSTAETWRSIVFDDFSSSENQFWLGDNQDNLKCELLDSKYVCTFYPNTAVAHWHWFGYKLADKFYLAVDARVIKGSSDTEYSIMFRRKGISHYLFTVRNDGYFKVIYYLDNESIYPVIDWTASPSIKGYSTNKLEVVADGGNYWFLINNDIVANTQDQRLSNGIAGIHMHSDTGDSDTVVEFDNYEFREP